MASNKKGSRRLLPGPKPKPESETRRNRLMLNLTDTEMKQLRVAAGDEPPVAFARRIILRYLARRRK